MVPVELSVNVTVRGLEPLAGLALKPAAGTSAPPPVTGICQHYAAEVRINGVEVTRQVNIGRSVNGQAIGSVEIAPPGAFGPQAVAGRVKFAHEQVVRGKMGIS